MGSSTLETLRTILPLLPLVLRQSFLHILHLSDSSKYLDLRSAIITACLRAILLPKTPRSISTTQRITLRDPGVKGRIWVSKYISPQPPETSIRDALITTLEHVGGSACQVPVLDLAQVEAEWTGYRSGVARDAPLPDMSEQGRYHGMMRQVKSVRITNTNRASLSAGGNLALSLLQLILELRKQDSPILWHGVLRQVPMPAGVALNSPWLDITQSSPAWEVSTPTPYDYLPKPGAMANRTTPPCEVWPANPPRRNMYVADDLAAHPLASLVMARSWKGAPPIYLCTGWEILAYEDKFFARKLEADGVQVVFEEYEGMPHCFAMMLRNASATPRCYNGWAGFIRAVVEDPNKIESRAVMIKAKTCEEVPLRFDELSDASEDHIQRRVLQKTGLEDRFHDAPVSKL
ncbi:hypothetical protein FGRMN_8664 [Fusarium graminum]|nr:hypothetical protein FGRMN_8664 [Fusarium graminum]